MEIVALTAKIDVLKKEPCDDKKNQDKRKKNKEESTLGKDSEWGWKKKKPTGNQTSKKMNGKTYYWCPNHGKEGMQVLHKPDDCHNKDLEDKPFPQWVSQATTTEDMSSSLTWNVNLTTFNTTQSDSN